MTTPEQRRKNYSTHKNIRLVGESELAFCEDCKGGESELDANTCSERIYTQVLESKLYWHELTPLQKKACKTQWTNALPERCRK